MAAYTAEPQFCDEFSPSECTGGSDVGSGSATYDWSVGATNIVRLNTSADQYAQTPKLYGVSAGGGGGYVNAEAGGCSQEGSGGPVTVQVPTDSRITQTVSQHAASCPAGQSGWYRQVYKIVTDQNGNDIVAGGQKLTEKLTVNSPAPLGGANNVTTGSATTLASGSFTDTYQICSSACPTNATNSVTQVISDTFNGPTYSLKPVNLVYGCSAITANGK